MRSLAHFFDLFMPVDLEAVRLTSFYALWTPMLMATSGGRHASPADVVATAAGVEWPVVTMVIAAVGVLAARLLSPRGAQPLSLGRALLVTLIMLIAAELWVIDTRPGLLFAFVVSIGLGFSGYSLIELMGDQIAAYVKRVFAALPIPAREKSLGRKPATPDPKEDDA